MDHTILWKSAGTGARKSPVPKALGITRTSAPTEMKRAKVPDKAQEKTQLPEDPQRKAKGVTPTRPEGFRMNRKMMRKRFQPQVMNHRILRTIMRIK